MHILLAAINAKYIHSNLAVYSLRAFAAAEKEVYAQSVSIAEYTINQQVDEILTDLYKKKPDVLCISCYLWNILYVEQLVRELPKVLPDLEIWLGGPEVSYHAEKVLKRMPQVRGVMRGEGENTFLELVRYYLREIPSLEQMMGITYMEKGEIRAHPAGPAPDLDRLPFVYEDLKDFQNRILYYESSRGCPFSCTYCLSSIEKCLRFRSLDLVKKELQFFIDREVPQVKFVDRTFNCRHEHAFAIWSYLAEHDRGKTNFHFEIAADLLREEDFRLIASMRPGLIQLEIGVQSTNQRTLRAIRRKMDFERVKMAVERIRDMHNVHQHLDLIAGLPYEDYESFRNSFDEVYDLQPEQLQLGFLKVLKGSAMEEQVQACQLLYQDRPPFEVLSTRWISYGEIVRLKGVEEMVEVYYNSGQFFHTMRLLRKAFPDAFSLYEALAQYYETHGLWGKSYSRIARYEILFAFILEPDIEYVRKGLEEPYRQALVYDLYLRENVKNRPSFAGAQTVTREESARFYEEEEQNRRYLPEYETYDRRQMRKMTHLERIEGEVLLFDYLHRDRRTKEARVVPVQIETK